MKNMKFPCVKTDYSYATICSCMKLCVRDNQQSSNFVQKSFLTYREIVLVMHSCLQLSHFQSTCQVTTTCLRFSIFTLISYSIVSFVPSIIIYVNVHFCILLDTVHTCQIIASDSMWRGWKAASVYQPND